MRLTAIFIFLSAALVTGVTTTALIPRSVAPKSVTNIDFRHDKFSQCYGQPTCVFEFGEIQAFRKVPSSDGTDSLLAPAEIYWDFIDGLGVLGGKEGDEIDPDEMLRVRLNQRWNAESVVLTDLFLGEESRDSQDGEEAIMLGKGDEGQEFVWLVSGRTALPTDELNKLSASQFFNADGEIKMEALPTDRAELAIFAQPDSTEIIDQSNGEAAFAFNNYDLSINSLEFRASEKSNNDFSVATLELAR